MVQFIAAVTRTPSKVKEFCSSRNIYLSGNLDDVLSDGSIDGVVITTPHSQHLDQIMQSVAAGKHVYCEKPWTLDGVEARISFNALADAGLKIGGGHNRRLAPNTLAMKKNLEESKLGKPSLMDGHFHVNFVPARSAWRDSCIESPAGGMTSMGLHAVDMFINLFGRISDVQVQSKRVVSPMDVDDSTLVRINFENGCTGHLSSLSATSMMGVFWLFA